MDSKALASTRYHIVGNDDSELLAREYRPRPDLEAPPEYLLLEDTRTGDFHAFSREYATRELFTERELVSVARGRAIHIITDNRPGVRFSPETAARARGLGLLFLSSPTDESLSQVSTPESVLAVSIHGSRLTTDGVRLLNRFVNMKELRLRDMPVPTVLWDALRECPDFQCLSLLSAAISPDFLSRWELPRVLYLDSLAGWDAAASFQAGAQVELLHLSSLQISDQQLREIARLPRLKSLWLNRSAFDEQGLASFIDSPAERLSLKCTQVSDVACQAISEHACLTSVSVDRTRITDAGALALAKIPKLKRLDLQRTFVTKACLEEIGRRRPDVSVQH